MIAPSYYQTTPQRLDAAAAMTPAYWRPITAAMRDHGVRLIVVPQNIGAFHAPLDRPFIAVVGDDLHEAHGPAAFSRPSLKRLIRAAKAIAIVASEPIAEAYAGAASVAVMGRNALIIETRPRWEADWLALVQKVNADAALLLCTVPGEGHA